MRVNQFRKISKLVVWLVGGLVSNRFFGRIGIGDSIKFEIPTN